ncbi:HGGxSTG domain-containing protein [uncultured Litoreibacter sp.]|uniref:HGGxSTG domain-containing protein n=1 Tax=uncultured Litoreibacter sp. TaxID=1392394 RepID=UPI00260ACD91|nr:HGGxSTG domain-containing protein [uncultured Litoreibacter sp.]
MTRVGRPCKSRVLLKSGRCKNHGGKSTGPRTPEGRKRVAEAQRKRWAAYRATHAQNDATRGATPCTFSW